MRPALLVVALIACQRTASDAPQGPLASCDAVAETLASLELGNYATPEQRAPAIAHHRQACATAKVTEQEAACLAKAHDTWAAATCVPRMFPKPAENPDCKEVAARVRQAIQVSSVGSNARQMIDKMMPAMEASCLADNWPPQLVQCIVAAKPGELAALEKCNAMMPKELQDRLQKRMMAAAPTP